MKFFIIFLFPIIFVGQSCSLLVEERLEEMKSNLTFMQIWRDHIKLWRDEIDSTSSQDYGGILECAQSNHTNIPISVHHLSPSDIEIIGALGASLMAGEGAGADSLFTLMLEYRGLSFGVGGDGDLSQMVTIPNILKQFNPEIFGQSYRVAPVWYERFSQLNLAVTGDKSEDLKNQAKMLVNRIKDIPFQNEKWKLITINIGTNDACQYCDQKRSSPRKWIKDYKKGLDYLYANLRKTYVNVVSVRSMSFLKAFQENHPVCKWFLKEQCPCLNHEFADSFQEKFNEMLSNLVQHYNRHDFTVEFQPFWSNVNVSLNSSDASNNDSSSDLSYMAPDCFHLSQKGHASAARSLWNNMLQNEANKSDEWRFDDSELNCPDLNCPFLRTRRNSIHCDYNFTEDYSEESDGTDMYPEYSTTREMRTWNTREPHNTNGRLENRSTIYIHRLTRIPPGLGTATDGTNLKALVVETYQQSNTLPWVIAGILGTIVIALMTLLVAQHYMTKRNKSTRPVSERSPLLPREEDQMY
jgi:phospholipase B1